MRLVVGDNVTRIYLGQVDDLDHLKLYEGKPTQGRVEICAEGASGQDLTYGTLCTEQWTNAEASVVCQELGFSAHGMYCLHAC